MSPDYVHHFTDTARLPWILKSRQLQPGRNKIGGYPDPDFLWASIDPKDDRTASAHRGKHYKAGAVRHVRFTLRRSDFLLWFQIPELFPQWAPHVARLESTARGHNPAEWFCREGPLPLSDCVAIHTRSYTRNKWVPLLPEEARVTVFGDILATTIKMRMFASRQHVLPGGNVGYELCRLEGRA